MPPPLHTRVTFSGTFGAVSSPVEVWQFNLNFGTERTHDQVQPTLENYSDLRAAWVTHIAPVMTSDIHLTRVRHALVGDDGRVRRDSAGGYIQTDTNGDWSGTVATTAAIRMPLQTSLVVSLQSAKAGAVGKGRFFLPWPATTLDADYRIGSALAAQYSQRFRDFVDDCVSAVHYPLVVASGGSALTGDPAGLYPVTSVRVGRVPDTMRSRRSHLLEGYASVALNQSDQVEK
jgi:hypothetical protein